MSHYCENSKQLMAIDLGKLWSGEAGWVLPGADIETWTRET